MKAYIIEKDGVKGVVRADKVAADWGQYIIANYTEQIPEEDVPFAIVTETADEYGNPTKTVSIDGSKKTAKEASVKKIKDVDEAYTLLNVEVYAEMEDIFYTKKSDSATANYEMWNHMANNPALYNSQGLKSEKQVNNEDGTELYSPGSALDTDEKIVAYAQRKVEQADSYIVWRSNRIQQFRNEKKSIEES